MSTDTVFRNVDQVRRELVREFRDFLMDQHPVVAGSYHVDTLPDDTDDALQLE